MKETPSVEPLILLIEDEPQLRRFLRTTLPLHGYRFAEAESGRQGLAEASDRKPDLILLDLGLPDVDGIEVTRAVRQWSHSPIIVLSARGRELDKVQALDAGADDYLTKPFGIEELLARIRVAFRHGARQAARDPQEAVFRVGELSVDLVARRVFVKERSVHLTPTQYQILTILIRNAGRVVTRKQLLEEVWGSHALDEIQYLRVYMGQLRHKLEDEPASPRYLLTETGVGYRLADE